MIPDNVLHPRVGFDLLRVQNGRVGEGVLRQEVDLVVPHQLWGGVRVLRL